MTDFNRRTDIDDKLTGLEQQLSHVQEKMDRHYESGWNAALELAAFEIEHNFVKAFGKDTLSSMAIYIRSLKKND
jgi:hypothetical protein